jgi:hypothetical protein
MSWSGTLERKLQPLQARLFLQVGVAKDCSRVEWHSLLVIMGCEEVSEERVKFLNYTQCLMRKLQSGQENKRQRISEVLILLHLTASH